MMVVERVFYNVPFRQDVRKQEADVDLLLQHLIMSTFAYHDIHYMQLSLALLVLPWDQRIHYVIVMISKMLLLGQHVVSCQFM